MHLPDGNWHNYCSKDDPILVELHLEPVVVVAAVVVVVDVAAAAVSLDWRRHPLLSSSER